MEGTPPGDALPPPPQRATAARKGARCGAGAGPTRPHRPHPGHTGRRTPAARSEGRAAGGGTAPDTRHPSQRWKAPPPGDALPPPPQRATPARKGARCEAGAGTTRPHRPRPGHAGRGTKPWLHAPEDERPGEGQRLTPGAPHNGGRHPPRGRPSATPTASNAGPQGRTLWGRCWVHTPASTAPGTHGSQNPGCTLRGKSGRGGDSAWHQAPLTTVEGAPPGDALQPPPQRATPARKGARCGAGAGSARPHRPHPGHAGRGTLAARSGGRAAREGTAPDTRRPSQRRKAAPPPPPGTPFRHPHSEQRRPARAHTLWGRCWIHTPASTAPGTRGSRNPGCTLRRTSGQGRDSA